jgi:hypothetical protein
MRARMGQCSNLKARAYIAPEQLANPCHMHAATLGFCNLLSDEHCSHHFVPACTNVASRDRAAPPCSSSHTTGRRSSCSTATWVHASWQAPVAIHACVCSAQAREHGTAASMQGAKPLPSSFLRTIALTAGTDTALPEMGQAALTCIPYNL